MRWIHARVVAVLRQLVCHDLGAFHLSLFAVALGLPFDLQPLRHAGPPEASPALLGAARKHLKALSKKGKWSIFMGGFAELCSSVFSLSSWASAGPRYGNRMRYGWKWQVYDACDALHALCLRDFPSRAPSSFCFAFDFRCTPESRP